MQLANHLPTEFNDATFRANPYPVYAQLRKSAPVHRMNAIFGRPAYVITRYEDVVSALKDPRFSNDYRLNPAGGDLSSSWWMPRVFTILQEGMLTNDDPIHQRQRNLVHLAFTPKRIEKITTRIEEVTQSLLDKAEKKNTIDLIQDFALPLPLTIISDLMGVPEKDRHGFYQAVNPFLESITGNPLRMLAQIPNANRLMRFFERMIALRRADPQDDLITALVQAEQAGDRLSQDELLSMIFLLLLAGHETTVNLIGNGTLALLEFPEQRHLLHQQPELIDRAVEELLRYANPVEHGTNRFLTEEVALHGVTMPKQSAVLLMLASANRDDAAFEQADQLILQRSPNRHISFGLGIHYCLGAPLARLEGKLALSALVQRFPNIALTIRPDQVPWRTAVAVRGVKSLPVRLK